MTDRFAALTARLEAVRARDASAVVSVWLGDLEGRARWSHRAGAPHYAASTMKLPLVIAAQRLAVRGALDLDAPVMVHNDFASVLDGSAFSMDVDDDQDPETWAALGGSRSARQLAQHAVTHSGNLATNLLLDLAEVAQRDGGGGRDLAEGAALLAAMLTQDVAQLASQQGRHAVLPILVSQFVLWCSSVSRRGRAS